MEELHENLSSLLTMVSYEFLGYRTWNIYQSKKTKNSSRQALKEFY